MNKEDKELLLRDLSARLSYGVLVQHENCKNAELKLVAVFTDGRIGVEENGIGLTPTSVDMCKPYLRPMSSMIEEERKEHNLHRLSKWSTYSEYCANVIDWLNAHHFDYRGLIERGLALEAPNGMYK